MLIGLSVSRCIVDLIDKTVDIDDVIVIVGRTHFNLDTADSLIAGYQFAYGPWHGYSTEDCRHMLEELWARGKIHQPRTFGSHPTSVPYGKHWMRLTFEPNELSASAKKAYDHYLLLAGLTSHKESYND